MTSNGFLNGFLPWIIEFVVTRATNINVKKIRFIVQLMLVRNLLFRHLLFTYSDIYYDTFDLIHNIYYLM